MTNKTLNPKYITGDIVTIAKDYMDSANLDFTQSQIRVYYVMAINTDGTIKLAGVWPDIPAKYVEDVPIESELAKQIYYNTVHARPYMPGKMYQQEDIYSRPPFMQTMAERFRNTPFWYKIQTEEFHFVHEVQHWLVEHYGYSRICIKIILYLFQLSLLYGEY